MVRSARLVGGLLLFGCTMVPVLAPAVPAARAATTRLLELKRLQQEILLSGGEQADPGAPRAEAARRGVSRKVRAAAASGRTNRKREPFGSHPPRDLMEAGGPQGRWRTPLRSQSGAQVTGPQPANVRVNDPLSEQTRLATQSEVSVATLGGRLVAVWNDGGTQGGLPTGIGFGYSIDGGRTWTDGGAAPLGGGVGLWTSDPVLTVDEKIGAFYLAGMVTTETSRNGVAVVRGAFDGGTFAWETPRVVRAVRDTLPDKPWIAADSLTGHLYLSYTTFFRIQGMNSDQIEFQRCADDNQTWTPAVRLSSAGETGLVQGSRPAVGPQGELYVVWKTIDTTAVAQGRDLIRVRISNDQGASFGPPVRVADVFTNFCSGAPGFNRGFGLGFPSVGVDRGTGPRRGRIYVAWEEPLDFYDDPLGFGPPVVETEANGGSATATPFELGATLRAEIAPAHDIDWFRFHGVRGQTAIVYLDSMARTLDVALRLWCGDGATGLAYSAPLIVRPRVVLYTLPETGDYFISVAPHDDSTGTYRIATGLAQRGSERGRDHRDVFVTWSDDGNQWSEPVRVNDDPPGFDAWLPEVSVGADGKVYLLWYDWRDADPSTCGGVSHVYMARSDDGGQNWASVGPVTRVQTAWSAVASNLAPNQGDYLAVVEDDRAVYPFWADGRDGDPDVYMATWLLPPTARRVEALEPEIVSAGLRLRWRSPDALPLVAVAYRRTSWTDWAPLQALRSDAAGVLTFTDATAEPGVRYAYRLGVPTSEGEIAAGEVSAELPDAGPARLAIERVQPNPTGGPIQVWFRRPSEAPATFELMDLGGRRWLSRTVGAEYGHRGRVDLDRGVGLPPGLYLVRLAQGGAAVTAKVVVLR